MTHRSSRIRRMLGAAAALTGAALVLSACAGGSDAGSTSAPQNLTIGVVAEPEKSPDPIIDGSLAGYNIYYNLFDQLTVLDADGAIQPSLATSWTPNDDFTQWTFTLRDDVKFQDGEPLTAADVVFTYETVLHTPDSDNLGYMDMLESVSAPDDHTVVFDLDSSFSPWPSITTAQSIVPEKVYTALGSEGFAAAPVGSGPFSFVSWNRGVDYVLKRNDDYWGGAPKIDTLTFQTVSDEEARLNGVISGSLDVALISPNQVTSAEGSGVDVRSRAANGTTFLGINSTAGPLADERIRQAVWHAIDREALVKTVLSGRAVANDQIIAANVAGYVSDATGPGYDPAAAKALLTAAGYTGEAIPLEYATSGRIPMSAEVAQAIAGYLEAVGITVTLSGMDQSTLSSRIYSTVDMKGLYLNTWAPSTMDGDMPATNLFAGGQNDYAKSPETAALVAKQRTVAGDDRIAVFRALAEANFQGAYIVPLFTPEADYAVSPKVTWTPRVDGLFDLSDAAFTG
ncbi:ABC transporter substrate-binding protein [Microbacterium flavum]|uniref:ABC transporter substrate-binding protein n=1 Tax=Microbacterium flavum TaxID=415216 RepID=A0ABS5XTX3_9MICO|nr:ABC transporter substrate-binding protein [Microbacterium flavum]MBT8796578.1 ABC transporter substrate-binding protein [Microbacterium flavum]